MYLIISNTTDNSTNTNNTILLNFSRTCCLYRRQAVVRACNGYSQANPNTSDSNPNTNPAKKIKKRKEKYFISMNISRYTIDFMIFLLVLTI